ncbi:MAG TPA: glycosyltransferase [Candidatus Babeliales bacterium]|nr:glycosyltransferase [Candidatus Babeliales bacterium]
MPNHHPSLSVIIPTRNRCTNLINLLQTLQQQTVAPQELVLIDGSDTPLNTHAAFNHIWQAQNFPATKLIYQHTTQLGSATQRNQGARLAQSTMLAFIDDDMLLDAHYLAQLQQVFRQDPSCMGAMGAIVGAGQQQRSWNDLLRRLFLLQRENGSGQFSFSGMPLHCYHARQQLAVAVLNGLAVYRRELFLQFLFDEKLGQYAYMEDCDLSYRISQAGHRLLYVPSAVSQHARSIQERTNLVANRALYLRNYSYLFFKNFYPKNRLRLLGYLWSVSGLFVEALLARNGAYLRGYVRGLRAYYGQRSLS